MGPTVILFPTSGDLKNERERVFQEPARKASGNSGLQFFLYFNGLNGNNLITAYDEAIEGEPMLMAKPVLKCKNPCDSFEVILPAIPTSGDPTAYVQNNVVALDVHSGFALMDDNKKTCIYSGQSDKLVTLGESAKHVGWLPATDLWEAARDYSR